MKLLTARSQEAAADSVCVWDNTQQPTPSPGEQWDVAQQVLGYMWDLKMVKEGKKWEEKTNILVTKETHHIMQ